MYVVVWHRNHLGILSANHLINIGNGIYSYNFSTDSSQVYGGTQNHLEISPGVWGMATGDANCDGIISDLDKQIWTSEVGSYGYYLSDFNMDREVDNQDKLDIWLKNEALNSHVPE